MTANQLQLLVTIYTEPRIGNVRCGTTNNDIIKLKELALIEEGKNLDFDYTTTDKGKVLVQHFLTHEMPKQKWGFDE
jgi:hypothetical protein